MKNNSQLYSDEINPIELIQTVLKGKWKIAAAVVISFIAAISYQSIQTKSFTATTEIKPINSIAISKYFTYNEFIADKTKTSKITESELLNLYFNIIDDKSLFQDAMHKLNLLEASQYNNDQEYNEAIIKLASSVKILPPHTKGLISLNNPNFKGSISFIYDDAKKWKNVLMYVDESANQLVKEKLLKDYKNALLSLKQNKEYRLEKLKILMTNTQIDLDKKMKKFEMNREFQLEDIQTKIDNALLDYDIKISDRLAFLNEQASIARKLKLANGTIEVQMLGSKNSMVTNIQTNTPFYLRGYEAIEKEMELIKSRDSKQPFVDGLIRMEQKKRSLEQDRTLLRAEKNYVFLDTLITLEKKLRKIKQDKTIEKIELAFQSTPLANKDKFLSKSTNLTTKFEYKNNKILVEAIVIGLIVGVFYVIISNALQSHRVSRKKTN